MSVKAIIIDDEQHARDLIRNYLGNFDEIELLAECQNGFEGLKAIQELSPDMIFLDVQMPKITGFEMLELLDELPVVIFSTAYDEFAIKAFELNAADYLLKPYGEDRFNMAVEKALERLGSKKSENSLKPLIETHSSISGPIDRVIVKSGMKIKLIPVEQIESIEAYDDYVYIFTPEGRFIKQQTMNYFEKNLPASEFIRVHRSHIVRLNQIVQIEPYGKDSKVLLLKSGTRVKVSRSGLKALKEKLGI